MNTTGPKNALPGADQVSRAYQAAKFAEEPPAEMDRVILAAARRRRRRASRAGGVRSSIPRLFFA